MWVLPAPAGASGAPLIPEGAESVRPHVSVSEPRLETLLDTVLANAVRTPDWRTAAEIAGSHPGFIVVTPEGDRFAADGWRLGRSAASPAALAGARREEEASRARLSAAEEAFAAAERARSNSEERASEAAAALDANDGRMSSVVSAIEQSEGELMRLQAEEELAGAHLAEMTDRSLAEAERARGLEVALEELHAEAEVTTGRRDLARAQQAELDERATRLSTLRTELQVLEAGLEERRAGLMRRHAEVIERLGPYAEESADQSISEGAEGLARGAKAAAAMEAAASRRLDQLEALLGRLRETRRQHTESVRLASDRLEALRRERAATETELAKIRERAQRTELDEAEARVRLEAAVESLRRELECEPEEAEAAAIEEPEVPAGITPAARARELERELRLMGPVNPLALEEFEALRERHEFLTSQVADVKQSKRDLMKVIGAIDADIQVVFAAAYADVADNFGKLFETLFPGGTGRLRLTDPDNLLETGIEVEARPSGKSVKRLSLLSGGERSLVALAFLFSVFRSRPSPFYLLDEVEAALDDLNLMRFLALLEEFRGEAQLIVVSHQKRTMEAADCLYGVTMSPGGSSKVISERVRASV